MCKFCFMEIKSVEICIELACRNRMCIEEPYKSKLIACVKSAVHLRAFYLK